MIKQTVKLVSAYLSRNPMATNEIADFIRSTHAALVRVSAQEPEPAALVPAVSIKKSVTPDAIICLECGKPQKMLKRHVSAAHGLTVDEYRAKWGLPLTYPMVAPDYAERRSVLAKKIGLGRKKGTKVSAPVVAEKPKRGPKTVPTAAAPVTVVAEKPKRGRKKATAE